MHRPNNLKDPRHASAGEPITASALFVAGPSGPSGGADSISDNRVVVKVTPLENIAGLLGYHAAVEEPESAEQAAAMNALALADPNARPVPAPAPVQPETATPVPPLTP